MILVLKYMVFIHIVLTSDNIYSSVFMSVFTITSGIFQGSFDFIYIYYTKNIFCLEVLILVSSFLICFCIYNTVLYYVHVNVECS